MAGNFKTRLGLFGILGTIASRYVVTDAQNAIVSQDGVPIADLKDPGGAAGDVFQYDGTRVVRVPAGPQHQVLTSAGPGVAVGYQPIPPQTIANVFTVGQSGDVHYTSIAAAIAAAIAAGASFNNPWVIEVAPGLYIEPKMTIPAGIVVQGIGTQSTVTVFPLDSNDDLFVLDGGTLVGVQVGGTTGAGKACVRAIGFFPQFCLRVSVIGPASVGFYVAPNAPLFASESNAPLIQGPNSRVETGFVVDGGQLFVEKLGVTLDASLLPAYPGTNPIELGGLVTNGGFAQLNTTEFVIPHNLPTEVGLRVSSGSFVQIVSGAFQQNEVALLIDAGAGIDFVSIDGTQFTGNTTNFKSLNATSTIYANCVVDMIKDDLVAGATLAGFIQSTSALENEIIGPTVIQFPTGKRANLPAFIYNQSFSGVADDFTWSAAGLAFTLTPPVIDSQPNGWSQRGAPFWDAEDVHVQTTTLNLPANATTYIYYDPSTDTVAQSVSAPGTSNIGFWQVVTDGTDVLFVNLIARRTDTDDLINDYLATTQKFRLRAGLAAMAGSAATHFAVAAGSYWLILTPITIAGSVGDATFYAFYGMNGASMNAPTTTIDVTNYDAAGVLTPMTAGWYRSDTLYVSSDGKFEVVYGTAQYAAQIDASTATPTAPPAATVVSAFLLATLIVQQGVGIVEIVDQRVTSHGQVAGTISAANLLPPNDILTQYLPVDGSRPMAGTLSMGGNPISNATNVNGVVVENHHARHQPGGIDAIPTAAPETIGTINVEGVSDKIARADHVHNHGAQTDPTQHAVAVAGGNAGFMSGADKLKVDAAPGAGTVGDLTYWDGTRWANFPDVAIGSVLISGGVATAPAWSATPTLTNVTFSALSASQYVKTDGFKALASQAGVPLADLTNAGGVNGDLAVWNGANFVRLPAGALGTALTGQGAGVAPSYQPVVQTVGVTAPVQNNGTATNPVIAVPLVSTLSSGLMSAPDKVKLNGLQTGYFSWVASLTSAQIVAPNNTYQDVPGFSVAFTLTTAGDVSFLAGASALFASGNQMNPVSFIVKIDGIQVGQPMSGGANNSIPAAVPLGGRTNGGALAAGAHTLTIAVKASNGLPNLQFNPGSGTPTGLWAEIYSLTPGS